MTLPFWNIPTCADLSAFFGKACPDSSGGPGAKQGLQIMPPFKKQFAL